jgi:predicted HTH transcriptional regulator
MSFVLPLTQGLAGPQAWITSCSRNPGGLANNWASKANRHETKTLEHKQAMPAGKRHEDPRVAFLAAVSAFANTGGGHLLIGIEATDGVASAIPGIVIPDVDAELLRLSNMLKDSIEPRLPSCRF